eukprot:1431740-Pleurochrysis_carterae.AAC.1
MDSGAHDETVGRPVRTRQKERHSATMPQPEICKQNHGNGVQQGGEQTGACHTGRMDGGENGDGTLADGQDNRREM